MAEPGGATGAAAEQSGSEYDQISANIEAVLEFYAREELKVGRAQRLLENASIFVGQPLFVALTLGFVGAWVLTNVALHLGGHKEFDPAPYSLLQGILGLGALLTATAVLTKQNRMTRQQQQRAHLDLKVTLLTEQKAAKLIHMVEELRRDLPNVRDRHDADAHALQQAMTPRAVLDALDGQPPGVT